MRQVLATSGGAGIGLAMAQAFAAQGDLVWVIDVDAAGLTRCPADWRVRQADAIDEPAMQAVIGEMGRIGVLCANAGMSGPTARIEDVRLEDWRACVSVDLEGAFLAAKHAARPMKEARQGAIVITSSTAGLY